MQSVSSSTADGTYKAGDTITINVVFSEDVTVNTSGGTPQLTLETGSTDQTATYSSGSGTNTLAFSYTVQNGDTSADLNYTATTSLALNGATIQGSGGNNAALTLPALASSDSLAGNSALVIDTTAPTVQSVSSSTADGTYTTGDTITINVVFSEDVTVNTSGGTPQLTLETGSTDQNAAYSSGSGTDTLAFSYTVQNGDSSADLNYTATTSLALNGATIQDSVGNNAALTLPALASSDSLAGNSALVIDTTAPTVQSVSSSTADGTYTTGDVITINVVFSEDVTVNTSGGTPQLTLETGSTDQTATYSSGSGTNTLAFSYTVQNGDTSADLNYTATTSLALNGATIQDSVGNNAALTLPALASSDSLAGNSALVIDTTAPTVQSVSSSTADGTYKAGDTITINVVFSEDVSVNTSGGTPQLTLETGSTDQTATYSSGSGTNTLAFSYTVQDGDTSADLNYTATTSLALNGATIQDSVGNNAALTLPALASSDSLAGNSALVIDTTAPTVQSVSSPPLMAPTQPATPSPSTSSSQGRLRQHQRRHTPTHPRNRFHRPDRLLFLWIRYQHPRLLLHRSRRRHLRRPQLQSHNLPRPQRRHHPRRPRHQCHAHAPGPRQQRFPRRQQRTRHRHHRTRHHGAIRRCWGFKQQHLPRRRGCWCHPDVGQRSGHMESGHSF